MVKSKKKRTSLRIVMKSNKRKNAKNRLRKHFDELES